MGYLAIRTLGPLSIWSVDDDGTAHPLQVTGGVGSAALLSAFVFLPAEIDTWQDVAAFLWDHAELEKPSIRNRFDKHMERLRTMLREHQTVLTKGHQIPGLVDRESGSLRIDWRDFIDYQAAGEHKRALALFDGLPLTEVKDGEGKLDIRELKKRVHEEVTKRVRASLAGAEVATPDTLDTAGPVIRQFLALRPAEWRLPAERSPEPQHAVNRSSRRRPPSLSGDFRATDLFEPCPEGEARLALELDQAKADGTHTWWSRGEWLGKFFAFWLKMNTRPCEEVAITLTDDTYDGARFGLQGVDEPKDKATILEAPSFYGDNPKKEILCGVTNWGLAYEYAKSHGDELLAHPSRPSVFGVVGRPAYPGIAGVHTLVQTADGYVLLGLRAPNIAFHERTWSATFEEQVAIDAREFTGPLDGDRTLRDVIEGGLYEEWGIDEGALTLTSCLAIGREWGRDRFGDELMLNLSATIITACRVDLTLADVWASLDESAGIEDVDEHRAWAGVRFSSRTDVLRFVAAAKGRKDNDNLLAELCARSDIDAEFSLYPRGATTGISDRGLMPTSAARLVLASGWFEAL